MGAEAGAGGAHHPLGFEGGKDEIRSGILLRGTCLKPPKTTGVYVAWEGLRKRHNYRSRTRVRQIDGGKRGAPLISNSEHFYCLEIWPGSTEEPCDFRQVVLPL